MSTAPLFTSPSEVLKHLAELGVQPIGVADDSRQVRPGYLFMAFQGDLTDGRRYIADAIAHGAAAVLWQSGDDFAWNPEWNVINLAESNLRRLCGPLAHAIFGRPSERLSLISITGTNGKTTVSQWIGRTHPRRCAVIGTLGAGYLDQMSETGFTTPEAATFHRYLAEFAASETQACALEASSIGIAEGRLDGSRVDVAVFTNLTRDHLDYHGSMESYASAKEALFAWPKLRLAVVNLDDPFGPQLIKKTTASKVIAYTQSVIAEDANINAQGVIRAENIEETLDGLRFRLCAPNGRAVVETGLLGRYNVSNLLAVAAVLIDAGLTPAQVVARFAELQSPPGRLEKIGGHNEPLIVVDYAHTPDALESALNALRGAAVVRDGRLISVFGCGGDRDRGKRPIMGEIATRLADRVVLTSDNPRSENPLEILDEIHRAAVTAEVIPDRAQAIRTTILSAHPADVILLAGKGHEPYQEIKGVRRPFSDLSEAHSALDTWKEVKICAK